MHNSVQWDLNTKFEWMSLDFRFQVDIKADKAITEIMWAQSSLIWQALNEVIIDKP